MRLPGVRSSLLRFSSRKPADNLPDTGLYRFAHLLAVTLGLFTIVGAALSFVGWVIHWDRLADWDMDGTAISPNCAVCAMTMGVAVILLYFRRERIVGYLGIFVLAVTSLTAFEIITGLSLHIDGLLTFGHTIGRSPTEVGRMGPPAALGWLLTGLAAALAGFRHDGRKFVPALGLVAGAIGMLSGIGYLFGASPLDNWPKVTLISSQTAVFLMTVGFGLVLCIREIAPTRVVFANSAAGAIARRTLPFAFLLPISGALRLYVVQLGLFEDTVSVAIFATALIAIFCTLFWYGIRAVDRHETELRQTQGFVSGLVGSITDGLAAFDKDWHFTFVNDEVVRRTGMRRDDLIGKSVWTLFPDSVGGEYHDELQRAMKDRVPVDHETFYEPWSIWLRDRAYPTPDGGLVVYTEDVTAQKESEMALEQQQRFTKEIIETAPSLTYIFDVGSGKTVFVSPQVKDLLGYEQSDIARMGFDPLTDLIHPADIEQVNSRLERVLDSRAHETFQLDYRVRHKDGRWVWLDDRARVFARDDDGLPTQMLAVATDMTARKNIEQRLQRSEANERAARIEAESANKAKDEFLAVLSHELRTPLNSMYGWAQILLKENVDIDTIRKGIEVIDRNIRQQTALIEDLLDVSRIITGKMAISHEPIVLDTVVRSAVEAVRPIADERQLSLELTIDPGDYVMNGDKNRLQQVVGNLLSNAIKFTQKNGSIRVRLGSRDGDAVIDVEDNGTGIDKSALGEIFQPFWQADSGHRRRHGGLGLGLTIVRNLVEIHGGSVTAKSDGPGKGSMFEVRLPLLTVPSAAHHEPLNGNGIQYYSDTALEGLKILIVDDDADTLDLMRYAIEKQGAAVTYCSNARDALRQIDAETFDLLISDIGMAGFSGHDLIRRIRENGKFKELPAIALSGYVSSSDEQLAVNGGYQRYLPKPVDFQKLTFTIHEVLKKRPVGTNR